MERDHIPFFIARSRLSGRLIHGSFGWGDRGDERFGGAFLLWANPDATTYSAAHRVFGPGEDVSDEWHDLTEEEAMGIASGIGRSQRRSPNFALARDERAARQLLQDLVRTEFDAKRAASHLLTSNVPKERPGGRPTRGPRMPRG